MENNCYGIIDIQNCNEALRTNLKLLFLKIIILNFFFPSIFVVWFILSHFTINTILLTKPFYVIKVLFINILISGCMIIHFMHDL